MDLDYYKVGIALLDNRLYKLAYTFLSKSIELRMNVPEAYLHRGIIGFRMCSKSQAIDDLTRSIELEETVDAYINRAIIYLECDDRDFAIADLRSVLKIDRDNIEALNNIIPLLIRNREFRDALELLNRLKPQIEITTEQRMDEIHIHFGLEEYEISLEILFNLIDFDPENHIYLNYAGFCYLKLDKLHDAERYFRKAQKNFPEYSYPLNNLGYIEYLRREFSKARQLILESLRFDPSNSYAYLNLAKIDIEEGNKSSALKNLNVALELGFKEMWGDEVNQLINSIR